MKVLIPSNTSQIMIIEPRFYPSSGIVLELYNEATKETLTIVNSYLVLDGVMTVLFDLETNEGDSYQVKILEGTEVVYRGKAFATDQVPQDYKLSNGLYIY